MYSEQLREPGIFTGQETDTQPTPLTDVQHLCALMAVHDVDLDLSSVPENLAIAYSFILDNPALSLHELAAALNQTTLQDTSKLKTSLFHRVRNAFVSGGLAVSDLDDLLVLRNAEDLQVADTPALITRHKIAIPDPSPPKLKAARSKAATAKQPSAHTVRDNSNEVRSVLKTMDGILRSAGIENPEQLLAHMPNHAEVYQGLIQTDLTVPHLAERLQLPVGVLIGIKRRLPDKLRRVAPHILSSHPDMPQQTAITRPWGYGERYATIQQLGPLVKARQLDLNKILTQRMRQTFAILTVPGLSSKAAQQQIGVDAKAFRDICASILQAFSARGDLTEVDWESLRSDAIRQLAESAHLPVEKSQDRIAAPVIIEPPIDLLLAKRPSVQSTVKTLAQILEHRTPTPLRDYLPEEQAVVYDLATQPDIRAMDIADRLGCSRSHITNMLKRITATLITTFPDVLFPNTQVKD